MPHFNLPELIQAIGYLGLFGIIFAETGLLAGFFLPGDSLLFTAGILAAEGHLNIALVILIMTAAAIIGNSTGYAIGRKFGPKVFSKENSLLFNKSHVAKAEQFFEKRGSAALIISRFVPVVRTFLPVVAGVGKMNYLKFTIYNIVGAVIWIFSVTLLGYYLGLKIDNIEKYLLPVIGLIILLSLAPYIKKFISNKEMRQQSWDFVIKAWRRVIKSK